LKKDEETKGEEKSPVDPKLIPGYAEYDKKN